MPLSQPALHPLLLSTLQFRTSDEYPSFYELQTIMKKHVQQVWTQLRFNLPMGVQLGVSNCVMSNRRLVTRLSALPMTCGIVSRFWLAALVCLLPAGPSHNYSTHIPKSHRQSLYRYIRVLSEFCIATVFQTLSIFSACSLIL